MRCVFVQVGRSLDLEGTRLRPLACPTREHAQLAQLMELTRRAGVVEQTVDPPPRSHRELSRHAGTHPVRAGACPA
jgi:hypothetical protein